MYVFHEALQYLQECFKDHVSSAWADKETDGQTDDGKLIPMYNTSLSVKQ